MVRVGWRGRVSGREEEGEGGGGGGLGGDMNDSRDLSTQISSAIIQYTLNQTERGPSHISLTPLLPFLPPQTLTIPIP